jgi:hypothetical protein
MGTLGGVMACLLLLVVIIIISIASSFYRCYTNKNLHNEIKQRSKFEVIVRLEKKGIRNLKKTLGN